MYLLANNAFIGSDRRIAKQLSDTTISLSLPEIAHALSPYVKQPLTDSQLSSVSAYLSLLRKWNQTIPLTSLDDEPEIVARHFGESIFASQWLSLQSSRLADVGSGAGFPGLPLKIIFPSLQLTLVESNAKKCAFLREVIDLLDLRNVQIVRKSYEEFAALQSFDYICARALGNYRRLLQWSRQAIKPGGQVILWLGIDDSISICRIKGWNWDLPINIPESRRRILLVGTKIQD